jgi:hypothetical protein
MTVFVTVDRLHDAGDKFWLKYVPTYVDTTWHNIVGING